MITRYDSSTVSAITKDPITGYIHARNVPIARAGVFKYLKPDGTVHYEAKLPEDILSDSAVASANNKPVTDNHPENEAGQRILVDKSNTDTLMKGLTASNAHVDRADGTVRVDLTITNPDLINKVDNGKRQLSIGFQTQVVPKSGVYKNAEYDSVQKDITINHVAVVDVAREGPDISLDRSVVGDSFDPHGKSEKDMKIEAIKSVDGDSADIDAQNDAYVNAYFKTVMNRKKSHFVGATAHDFKGDSADASVNQMHENFYNLANKNKGGNK